MPKECAYQPNYPGGRMSTIHNKNYTIHKMCYMDAIQDTVHAQNYTIHKLYYRVAIQDCKSRECAQVPRWQDVNNATQFASVIKAGCRFCILKISCILRFHTHK